MMKIEEIKKMARNSIGSDEYYEKLNSPKSDYHAFDDIWSQYSQSMDYLENAFAVFWVLKTIVKSLNAGEEIFTTEEIKNFVEYFEDYLALYITDYIGDFVGCSHGCSAVAAKLEKIKSL